MRYALMASSALAGVAMLGAQGASAQTLDLSAFQHFYMSAGSADVDTSDRSGGFATNTEVHVNGTMMADNGVTFGFRVEFEADTGESTNVDENSIFVEGSFGRIELGANDGAEDFSMVNGSAVGVQNGGVGNPTGSFLETAFAGGAPSSVDMLDSSDAVKITYITPNFDGLTAGISYTPDREVGNSKDGGQFNAQTAAGADTGTPDLEDHIGLGLQYDGEFGDVGVVIGLAGGFGEFEQVASTGDKESFYSIGGGVMLSFAGFSVAAGAFSEDSDVREKWAVDYGLGYSAGPWRLAVAGITSKDEITDDELLAFSANVGYSVAPGVLVFLTGYVGSEDLGSGTENDISSVTSGIKVGF